MSNSSVPSAPLPREQRFSSFTHSTGPLTGLTHSLQRGGLTLSELTVAYNEMRLNVTGWESSQNSKMPRVVWADNAL